MHKNIHLSFSPGFSVSQVVLQLKEEKSQYHLHGLRQSVWQPHQLFGSAEVDRLAVGVGVKRRYRHYQEPLKSHFKEGLLAVLCTREPLAVSCLKLRRATLPAVTLLPMSSMEWMEYKGLVILAQPVIAILASGLPMELAKAVKA